MSTPKSALRVPCEYPESTLRVGAVAYQRAHDRHIRRGHEGREGAHVHAAAAFTRSCGNARRRVRSDPPDRRLAPQRARGAPCARAHRCARVSTRVRVRWRSTDVQCDASGRVAHARVLAQRSHGGASACADSRASAARSVPKAKQRPDRTVRAPGANETQTQ